ncbi:MAG: hypothetical protein V3W20_13530 [Candidatus Neomarinimicrobiota bacterium]
MNKDTKQLVKVLLDKTPPDVKLKYILCELGKGEITVQDAIDKINQILD